MTESLEVPTATSTRTLSAKLLDENRRILNEHLRMRALGKASFTHLIAFALVRAIAENPRVQSAFLVRDGRPQRFLPAHVNLGLAIDVPGPKGRMLVVPSIKAAETLSFGQFFEAYEDIVRRGRAGQLGAEDYRGTSLTLTNPGGFGTTMSVARLMKGQGLIVATGSIGVPPELAGMARSALAELALGPVMTMTSTYDHRVVQGAESGLLLKRVDELLQGADGFYDEIFGTLRVPWTPARASTDLRRTGGGDLAEMQAKLWKMINAYRTRGSRLADLDPLGYKPDPLPSLDPASYGFTVWDLDRTFLSGGITREREATLREILATLRHAYCRRWTIEYMHITDRKRKHWIREVVEDREAEFAFEQEHRMRILDCLTRAEAFERFLHTRYVGNKRFSLEGADTLIPALAEIIERAAEHGVERVVIGMAHRGRLNVLANILGKSYDKIFREFQAVLLPLSAEGSGDVKYHLGQRGTFVTASGQEVDGDPLGQPQSPGGRRSGRVRHDACVPGRAGGPRATQGARRPRARRRRVQRAGVVAETFNMSELRAYTSGGTIHVVVNNQIGFTASPRDLRSTYYCTDTAKSVEAPILHANGDFPESVLRAARIAVDYQREFGGDAVVDMVCYRRWGHNEGDEPAYTQPVLYAKHRQAPDRARELHSTLLVRREALTRDEANEIQSRSFEDELRQALEGSQSQGAPEELPPEETLDLVGRRPGWTSCASDRRRPGVPAERAGRR